MLGRLLCSLCLGLLCVSGASAWGVKGHAAVAALAEAALTSSAREEVSHLLADDLDRHGEPSGRKTLAAVASWADEIRDEAPPEQYRGWHVRANSVCTAKPGPCRDGHCVDQLILQQAAVLADRGQGVRARNEALKWVVHLVGDLHQPLHSGVASDRGLLPVMLPGAEDKPTRSLHQVWDSELALMALSQGPLRPAEALPIYTPDAVEAWMQESRALARGHVYEALPGFSCEGWLHAKAAQRLDEAYQRQAMPVIRLQMERAGARLAALLNAVLQ